MLKIELTDLEADQFLNYRVDKDKQRAKLEKEIIAEWQQRLDILILKTKHDDCEGDAEKAKNAIRLEILEDFKKTLTEKEGYL